MSNFKIEEEIFVLNMILEFLVARQIKGEKLEDVILRVKRAIQIKEVSAWQA